MEVVGLKTRLSGQLPNMAFVLKVLIRNLVTFLKIL